MSVPDERVVRTFVELADTLVADFDLIDFLHVVSHRFVELLGVDAAGLLLADTNGLLSVVAASDDQATLEQQQLQDQEGAAIDCYRTGSAVLCDDPAELARRWPGFAEATEAAGFTAVAAVPMRLRDDVIGAVNLFGTNAIELTGERLGVGQALADIATIGILHERTFRRHEVLVGQLQTALNSRIITEQAKGVLAERLGVDMTEAFAVLRSYARSNNRRLIEVATTVVEGGPEADSVAARYRRPGQ
ncbi:GAF and ANTAR domain-containing protein [Amycolatopsis sp.]|uniref:GAF and ANTAR domain-containing protein n=1 Tax=Amycolatopsis sp. TaxID=37632 RepID=UPI002C08788B|nr:GAF and ANTAR domain-containing protein [Amycolatopsis sp.]HVV09807.1 GAF and ANTAR domain-containing protein [Amycolatopsis sp.]